MLASPSRAADYEPLPETGGAAWPAFEIRHWLAPLVLENPEWPEAPRATFRHAPTEQAAWTPNDDTGADLPLREVLGRARRETVAARLAANDPALLADDGRGLLQVARDMRGNRDTERRRPRLLPPPRAAASDPVDDPVNLPFLPGTRHA